KLRDKVNDEVADLKRERNDLKADIDSIEMRAYEDWDDAKKDVNKAFDRLEEDVDDLAKDIDKEGGKAIDKTKKVLRDEKRDVEERRTHD
ncbi:MAG TPA: hypothetical protein VFB62_15130, partial [Polyangiaceae bacterium]|nr:hypothetical protein [Polyangiaceae bacterium]